MDISKAGLNYENMAEACRDEKAIVAAYVFGSRARMDR